ncbi:MAG: hypothetical protein K2Z81_19685 [Cyanobacteria bacterium]|nr:hypothetical protein [Cyanobacteriota bacterium]
MRTDKTSKPNVHPNLADRNKSILWARYTLDSQDWVILSLKVTWDGENLALATLALMDGTKGKMLVESMVKSDSIVSAESIARHGVEQSVVFHAKSYADVRAELMIKASGKEIFVWDAHVTQELLNRLDNLYGEKPMDWRFNDVSTVFGRYMGAVDESGEYEVYPLPASGTSAKAECTDVRGVLTEMASTSQATDSVAGGKPGWTAEFYRPKRSPKDKIKDMLGMRE